MSKPHDYRVFISSVTKELGSHRQEAARVLRKKEIEVRDQEHFRQGGGVLLESLRDYIEKCDTVVLLIGERCGAFPEDIQVAQLGPVPAFEQYRSATGQQRASYTQWEFFLAKHYGKKTYVHFSSPGFTPDAPNDEAPDLQACQQAYRGWIRTLGEHYDPLITKGKLVENVLLHPFPDLSRPKPIHLPYPTLGRLFIGRERFVEELKRSLQQTASAGHATAIVNAVYGLGGVGKTRLAVEYAWQHEQDYSALLCVVADSPESLQANLAALCGPLVLDLPEKDATEQAVQVAAALAWLHQHPGWFLIVDNVDTPDAAEAVEELLGDLHGGQVLITSRIGSWSGSVTPLELDVLSETDAARFLLERTQPKRRRLPTDQTDATALARELDGLALALEQAGAYVLQTRCSLADYLRDWQAHLPAVQQWFDATKMKYPRSVAVTWETTLGQLGAREVALLRLLSWLAPEPVPQFMLEGEKAEEVFGIAVKLMEAESSSTFLSRDAIPDSPQPSGAAPDPAASVPDSTSECRATLLVALQRLADFSMVKWDATEQTVTVHRVVQEILRTRLPEATGEAWLTLSLHLVNWAAPNAPDDVRTWPQWLPLSPHVAAVARHGEQAGIHQPTTRLMACLGNLLWARALHQEAEDWMRRDLAFNERVLGPDHAEVALRLNNLAQTLEATNRLAEAEPLMRRALAIDEKNYGPDHPEVAIPLNNLAALLYATNRPAEAEPMYRRALGIDEKSYGPDHPNVARDLNNLAGLLEDIDRKAEAEPMYRRVVSIFEKSYGLDHPNVATAVNNLALLFKNSERSAEAEPMFRRALAISEKSLGPDHPYVAVRLTNLAVLLHESGRSQEALPLIQQAVAIFQRSGETQGYVHPHLATAQGWLKIISEVVGGVPHPNQ